MYVKCIYANLHQINESKNIYCKYWLSSKVLCRNHTLNNATLELIS